MEIDVVVMDAFRYDGIRCITLYKRYCAINTVLIDDELRFGRLPTDCLAVVSAACCAADLLRLLSASC